MCLAAAMLAQQVKIEPRAKPAPKQQEQRGANIRVDTTLILVPVTVNGMPGFAQYKPAPDGEGYVAWAIQAPEIRGDKIVRLNAFLDVEALFPMFGLPLTLEAPTAG